MRGILAKIGLFFESHIEKIVLVLFGGLSLWLLFAWVAFSPNKMALDRNSSMLSPGQIDEMIKREYVPPVEERLALNPEGKATYEPRLNGRIEPNDSVLGAVQGPLDQGLVGLYTDTLAQVSTTGIPLPGEHRVLAGEGKAYQLPVVGAVTDVDAEHIRAAAYIPVESLSEDQDYASVEKEPNDLDLVTVQGTFNVALLRERFYESFASEALPEDWRDPAIAKPVFAAVDLERQQQRPDGSWGDWQSVARPRTDQYRNLFKIVDDVNMLPAGGIRARMLKLDQEPIRLALLQPLGYAFASAYEEWYPPALHREYLDAREKERLQQRRDERETRDAANNNNRGRGNDNYGVGNDTQARGGRNPRGRNAGRGQDGRGVNVNGRGGPNAAGARGRNARDAQQRGGGGDLYAPGGRGGVAQVETEMDKVNKQLNDILIKPRTEVKDMDKLVFWAHDDTVRPGENYRYRLRLGVINPVAGTNNISKDELNMQNHTILWSDFSGVTPVIDIPKREYFFVRDFQESSGNVSVEVDKFFLGYWRSENFNVKPGEIIGHVVEKKKEEDNPLPMAGRGELYGQVQTQEEDVTSDPAEIDYNTNILFVDAVRVDNWTGGTRLRPQIYYEALYSDDSETLEHVPVGSSNWPDGLSKIYGIIKKAQREDVEPFKGFDLGAVGNRGVTTGRGRSLYGEGAYGG